MSGRSCLCPSGGCVGCSGSIHRRERKGPRGVGDEAALTADITALARQSGRYGYRQVTALRRDAGSRVNRIRIERIWRKAGLKVPHKQPERSWLWLNDGSCIRLRPGNPGHVWSYNFAGGRTHDGRKFRILSIINEASRKCLAMPVARRLQSQDVLAALSDLFMTRGLPAHICSDNAPDFLAKTVQHWLGRIGAKTLTIARGRPWENGHCESLASPPFGSTSRGATSSSMARSSTRWPRPRGCSRSGAGTTGGSAHTAAPVTARRPRKRLPRECRPPAPLCFAASVRIVL